MRIPDALLMACVLIVAPLFAWAFGRSVGRRDWKMLPLLGGAFVIAAAMLVLMAGLHALSPVVPVKPPVPVQPLADAVTSPEFAAFVVVSSWFIAMLGWSSVPVTYGHRDKT
jgi:hypothetical protein